MGVFVEAVPLPTRYILSWKWDVNPTHSLALGEVFLLTDLFSFFSISVLLLVVKLVGFFPRWMWKTQWNPGIPLRYMG